MRKLGIGIAFSEWVICGLSSRRHYCNTATISLNMASSCPYSRQCTAPRSFVVGTSVPHISFTTAMPIWTCSCPFSSNKNAILHRHSHPIQESCSLTQLMSFSDHETRHLYLSATAPSTLTTDSLPQSQDEACSGCTSTLSLLPAKATSMTRTYSKKKSTSPSIRHLE